MSPRKLDPPARQKTPPFGLHLAIPEYLDRELAMVAAAERVTKLYLVLKALAEAGFHIEPTDLVPDGRRKRRN
jgi:hypothetical protein